MSYPQSFRDIDAYGEDNTQGWQYGKAMRPAWAVINDKTYGGPVERNQALLDWKNTVTMELLQMREPITRVQRCNIMLYKGKHYFSQEQFSQLPYNRNKKYSKNHAKIVVNHLHQVTENHVADMASYEPNITVIPNNDEESDKVAARENKNVLDHYIYENKLKVRFQTFHRRVKVCGEAFMFVLWNSNLGDIHPSFKQLRQMRVDMGQDPDTPIPLVDENGEQVVGEDGEPLWINETIRTGDIQIEQELSEKVLYPYVESCMWDDVPWIERLVWTDVDEVKARWPNVAADIKSDGLFRRYLHPNNRSVTSKVCVRYFYHKPTQFLDSGYYCISTESVILEAGKYPFNHKYLPCIRGTDIDVPGELTGMSFYQNLASLQHAINNSTSMILQNQALFAYPKYKTPRGAKVQYRDLDDDRGIFEYSGAIGPELMVNNSTPTDTWRYRDMMRDEFKNLSAIFATSQGNAPDGITANVALRMIDEQERKLHKPAIDKHGENCEIMGTLILSTLGTYREPSDGMLIKILGKNQERYLRYFDVANLATSYEVKLMRSSGLPESPAARSQTVLDYAQAFPDLWEHDEVLEMLDIQRPEKLVDSATVARQAAESEVEDILQGLTNVLPPASYHDILPRYRVYEKAVQTRAFQEAPPDRQQRMLNMIITAEYLIWKKMGLNPMFQQLVFTKHPNFPMFFTMPPPPPMPMGGGVGAPMGSPNSPPIGGVPPQLAGPGGASPSPTPAVPAPGPLPQPNIPQAGTLP